jgi:L-amino acid N-acyltransferase YncA
MTPDICQIRDEDIASFHATLSVVIRERAYLAFLEPPTFENAAKFVRNNIERGYPQLVARFADQVVGWCDITPAGRDVSLHVGSLGMGLAPEWRGQGLGERLMRAALDAGVAYGFTRIELTPSTESAVSRMRASDVAVS